MTAIQKALVELRELVSDLLDLLGLEGDQKKAALELVDQVLEELLGDEDEEDGLDLVDHLADFLDGILALDLLVPGVAGKLLEAYDGPAIETALRTLVDLFKRDPDVVASRAAARKLRREAREDRRARNAEERRERRRARRRNRRERRELRRSREAHAELTRRREAARAEAKAAKEAESSGE